MPLIFPVADAGAIDSVPAVLATSSDVPGVNFGSATIPAPPNFQSQVGSWNLEHQGPLVPDQYDRPLFNDYGFVVRAKTDEGEDILLWTFVYRQQGPEIIINNDVTQTCFIAGKFSDTEKIHMHDLPYISKGQNIEDYFTPSSIKFETTSNSVTWSIAGRELIYAPPYWHAKGTHAGVELDLTMTPRGDCFFHVANFEDHFDTKTHTGVAGGNIHLRVNGTIKANGKTYTITNGHGVHERILMAGFVPERINYMGKGGSPWIHGWGEQLSFFTISRDTGHNAQLSVNVDGETLAVQGPGWVITKEREQWLDPKTKQANPRKWTIFATTQKGKFEATITGYARWYYTWTRRGGILVVHTFMCDTVMTFTRNDGSVINEKGVGVVEYMRTLYNQNHTQLVESL